MYNSQHILAFNLDQTIPYYDNYAFLYFSQLVLNTICTISDILRVLGAVQ